MACNGRVTVAMSHFDRIKRFAQRSDLVNLDQDRVGATLRDTFREELNIGHEKIVAHQLATVADALGEFLPALPIVFAHTVLDRVDRIFADQLLEISDLLVCRTLLALGALELGIIIDAVLVKL